MSEPMDHSPEAQPLKRGEEGVAPQVDKAEGKRFSRLSRCRTAAFFISLFLCLIVVFTFSFIIPCPVRPIYLAKWNHTYPDSVTYDFLAVADSNKDKVLDVLFVLKATVGSLNTTCLNEMGSPCVFLTAVAGTNGATFWERPFAREFFWAQCNVPGPACLLFHSSQLTAVDQHTGAVVWQRRHPTGMISTLPVLPVSDLDGDDWEDVALIGLNQSQTLLTVISSKTGDSIGLEVVVTLEKVIAHQLHTTKLGAHYILLQTDSGLYAQGWWKIASQVRPGSNASLKRDPTWEKRSNSSGYVLLRRSASLQQVLRVRNSGGSHNLLLVMDNGVELLDGDGLQSVWRVNTSKVLSKPTIGYYNKDDVPDVVLEEDSGSGTKRVMVLDGNSGLLLWEVKLLQRPNSPAPISFRSIHTVSVFVFWGEILPQHNTSENISGGRFTYMLHPQHPTALLEKNSTTTDHIVVFKGTLLERGRHACFLTLTGPEGAEPDGMVTMAKRKLKNDVPESRVCWLGGTRGDEYEVKDAFNRLRFKQDT